MTEETVTRPAPVRAPFTRAPSDPQPRCVGSPHCAGRWRYRAGRGQIRGVGHVEWWGCGACGRVDRYVIVAAEEPRLFPVEEEP